MIIHHVYYDMSTVKIGFDLLQQIIVIKIISAELIKYMRLIKRRFYVQNKTADNQIYKEKLKEKAWDMYV